jgi:hypothetical protein
VSFVRPLFLPLDGNHSFFFSFNDKLHHLTLIHLYYASHHTPHSICTYAYIHTYDL